LLLHPLPYPAALDNMTFTSKVVSIGESKLECISENPKAATNSSLLWSYCLDQSLPIIRISTNSYGQKTIWSGVVQMYGHYIAKQVRVGAGKQDPLVTAEIEQLDPQLGIEEAALAPPPDAKPFVRKVIISSGVTQGRRISGDDPEYPPTARSVRTGGTVVLKVTISKEGEVKDVEVVSGPSVLQSSAVKAVRTWRYRPYLLEGEPVQVETTVNIVFNLGGPPQQ
jgi:TonB family protein